MDDYLDPDLDDTLDDDEQPAAIKRGKGRRRLIPYAQERDASLSSAIDDFLSRDFRPVEPEASALPSQSRTWGAAIKDVGAGLAEGAGSLVEGLGTLGGMATGNVETNPIRDLGKNAKDYWSSLKSDALKSQIRDRATKVASADGELQKAWTAVKETITNPALAIDFFSNQAANLAAMAAVGPALGLPGVVGTGAALQGADVATETYDDVRDIRKIPDAVWDANPEFQKLLAAPGTSREEAKIAFALKAARQAGTAGALVSVITTMLPGGSAIEKFLAKGTIGKATGKAGMAAALKEGVKGAAGEGVSEALEEGGGQFSGNLAKREIDPNQSLSEGTGEAAGLGWLGGVGMGGPAGVISGATLKEPPADIPTQIAQMLDANHASDAVFIPAGQENLIPADLPDSVKVVSRPEGTMLTTNAVKANQFNQQGQEPAVPETGPNAPETGAAGMPQQEPVAPGVNDDAEVDQLLQNVPEITDAEPAATPAPAAPAAAPTQTPTQTQTAAPAAPAAPAVADRPDLPDAHSRYDSLIQVLSARAGGAPIDISTITMLDVEQHPVMAKLAAAFKQAFGVNTLLVNATGPVKTLDGRTVWGAFPHGVSLPNSKTIVLNMGNIEGSLMTTIGHELAHQLKAAFPKLWAPMAAILLEKAKKRPMDKHIKFLQADGVTKLSEINEEVVSEIVGEQMGSEQFWNELFAKQDRSFVESVMAVMKQFLNKLTRALTNNGQWIGARDVGEVRNAITTAFNAWEAAEQQRATLSPSQEGGNVVTNAKGKQQADPGAQPNTAGAAARTQQSDKAAPPAAGKGRTATAPKATKTAVAKPPKDPLAAALAPKKEAPAADPAVVEKAKAKADAAAAAAEAEVVTEATAAQGKTAKPAVINKTAKKARRAEAIKEAAEKIKDFSRQRSAQQLKGATFPANPIKGKLTLKKTEPQPQEKAVWREPTKSEKMYEGATTVLQFAGHEFFFGNLSGVPEVGVSGPTGNKVVRNDGDHRRGVLFPASKEWPSFIQQALKDALIAYSSARTKAAQLEARKQVAAAVDQINGKKEEDFDGLDETEEINDEPGVRYSRVGDREPAARTDATGLRGRGFISGSAELLADAYRKAAGRELAGKPKAIDVPGWGKVEFHSFGPAQQAAASYMRQAGLPYNPPTEYTKVDPARAKRIAQAYEAMPHDPANPEVKAAYDALIRETTEQYKAVLGTGLHIEFIDFAKQGNPYQSPRHAIIDVVLNNHLYVFSTRDGFGSNDEADIANNPLLAETPFKISGQTALANDLFRVVHDYFGHIANGVGFRADGEENAWREHAAMFSPLARRALTSETRGQNSWVNFGPHGETNRTANDINTVFADQKTGLMPDWTMLYNEHSTLTNEGAANERPELSGSQGDSVPAPADADTRQADRAAGPAEPAVRSDGNGAAGTRQEEAPQALSIRPQQADAHPPVAVTHYGKQSSFPQLTGKQYGTGIKGAEARRLQWSKDQRIKERVYFYLNDDSGLLPKPEAGLGNHVYQQTLGNLYDLGADPLDLREKFLHMRDRDDQFNAMESAIIDAGYDGYLSKATGTAVVLGADVPVQYAGRAQDRKLVSNDNGVRFSRVLPDVSGKYLHPRTEEEVRQRFANRLKNPITLKDGTRLSGFTDPENQTTLHGYLKSGARITMRAEYLDPDDIVYSRDDNRTAEAIKEGLRAMREPAARFSRVKTDTPAFKHWFGLSTVTNRDGSPKVMYHGTAQEISAFRAKQAGAIFVTEYPEFAQDFANSSEYWMLDHLDQVLSPEDYNRAMDDAEELIRSTDWAPGQMEEALRLLNEMPHESFDLKQAAQKYLPSGQNIMPLYVKAERSFDWEDHDTMRAVEEYAAEMRYTDKAIDPMVMANLRKGSWRAIEKPEVQEALRAIGFDSFYVLENGIKNLAVYQPTQLKSAVGNYGNFDPNHADIRFSRQKPMQGNRFQIGGETIKEWIQNLLQDNANRIKKVQDAVASQAGGVLSAGGNAYKAMERFYGRASSRVGWFNKYKVKPLIREMAKAGVDIDDLGLYLYARHAKERNEYIASINPGKFAAVDAQGNRTPDLDNGSGMTTQEARQILAAVAADPKFQDIQRFAQRIDAITNETRMEMVRGGLIDPQTAVAWINEYQHYVPLKGFENADELGVKQAGAGRGFDLRGSESRRALGRESKAGQIVQNIMRDHERTILRSEKNKVARAFLKFVSENPDDKLWEVNRMVLKPQFQKSSGTVLHRLEKFDDSDRVIIAKKNGKEYHITINDAKLLQQLIGEKGLFNYGGDAGQLFNGWALINRTLTKLWTALNPVFTPMNFARDYMTAAISGATAMGPRFAAKVAGYAFPAIGGIIAGERSDTPTVIGPNGPQNWREWYQQYQEDGGKAGFYQFGEIEDKQRELEGLFKEASNIQAGGMRGVWGRSQKFGKAAHDLIMDINGGIENATRVAAYRAAIEAGKSRAEASSIAKNLTVNFNRRGVMTPMLGSFWLFFNPSVQGVARIMQAAKDNPKTFGALVGGLVGLGFMLASMNAGDKDDEGVPYWDKKESSLKERNILIATGGGNYAAIPMAYGYGWFVHLGYAMADVARGQPIGAKSLELFKSFLQHYSPIGIENPAMAMVPTAAAPLLSPLVNQTAFGTPLMPEEKRMDGTPVPPSERYWSSTRGSTIERFTTWLNEATGGDKAVAGALSISPEVVKNLITGYTGGAGSFLTDVAATAMTTATLGWEVAKEKNEIPFRKQLYKTDTSKLDQRYFMEQSAKALEALNEAKQYYNTDKPSIIERIDGNRGLAKLGAAVHQINMVNSSIRKKAIQIQGDESLTARERYDQMKELEQQQRDIWKRWNGAWYAASNGK